MLEKPTEKYLNQFKNFCQSLCQIKPCICVVHKNFFKTRHTLRMRITLDNRVSNVTDFRLLCLDHKMPRRKLLKWKPKNKTIVSFVEEESDGAKCDDFPLIPFVCENEAQKWQKFKEKSSKQVHFAVLPDRYEPLEEDMTSNPAAEKNQKRKYKRFRKNFGKAFRYTWKCLVVGLQSFSTSYSGPLSAASTLVPEIQRTRPKA